MIRRLLVSIAIAVALGGVLTPAASARTETSSGDGVTATLSLQGKPPVLRAVHLTITRNGAQLYSAPVTSRYCSPQCDVALFSKTEDVVDVADLDGDGTPEVVVDLFTGGAHCCTVAQVFAYDPGTQTYGRTERDFGDPGHTIKRLGSGSTLQFVSADDRFAYRFTDFAASGLPLQILQYARGRFADVAAQYPKLIAADAAGWLKAFNGLARSHYSDSVGVIAAWAADEYRLGRQAQVDAQLRTWAKAGKLRSALYGRKGSGLSFVTALERFLRRSGYTLA